MTQRIFQRMFSHKRIVNDNVDDDDGYGNEDDNFCNVYGYGGEESTSRSITENNASDDDEDDTKTTMTTLTRASSARSAPIRKISRTRSNSGPPVRKISKTRSLRMDVAALANAAAATTTTTPLSPRMSGYNRVLDANRLKRQPQQQPQPRRGGRRVNETIMDKEEPRRSRTKRQGSRNIPPIRLYRSYRYTETVGSGSTKSTNIRHVDRVCH